MRRHTISPRRGWQATVESQGLHFHTSDGLTYWDESVYYSFTSDEVDLVEEATTRLDEMCQHAVARVLENEEYLDRFGIPPQFRDWVRASWERESTTIYGRFDLGFRPGDTPRLLEYNADTPTALLEAAVIQWFWLQDTKVGSDQFNSIHERLIDAWKELSREVDFPIYFASLDDVEDYMTTSYLRETAVNAGVATEQLEIGQVSWNPKRNQFVTPDEKTIRTIFKLYPWEWMLREQFAPHLLVSGTRWVEPPWKMVLSNKAILPVLWEMFPDSPYLLRAEYEPFSSTYVRKPMLGREGSNVSIVRDGQTLLETDGPYDGEAVYQEVFPLPQWDGHYAVLGSWMVNGHACGMGVREDAQPVTRNTSRFVPHCIE
jgi:glutathionylspermidine synthase